MPPWLYPSFSLPHSFPHVAPHQNCLLRVLHYGRRHGCNPRNHGEYPSSEVQWKVATTKSDRAYNWGQSIIAPDAVGEMITGGIHIPFYLEHEFRARHPRGVIAHLRPYERYYYSPKHKDDQPPFPVTLFIVETEEVETTYVNTAARMSRMSLPILVSCITVLSTTGILGKSWRPLWEPESARLPLSGLSAYGWNALYRRMRHRPVEGR